MFGFFNNVGMRIHIKYIFGVSSLASVCFNPSIAYLNFFDATCG
jgi:hypothetical protein